MIQTVFSAELPAGERLLVRKNRIKGAGGEGLRIAVVTGMHGDELEGQYIACELARILSDRLYDLKGTVDIYPALNPLGINSIERRVPLFDIDLDRSFPGNERGTLIETLANAVLNDIRGASVCIDIHSSSIFLREVPQIRIPSQHEAALLPFARLLNTQLVWVYEQEEAQRSTLAHALATVGTRCLVVEMGVGLRITEECGTWLTEGILRLLEKLGVWSSSSIALPNPLVFHDYDVSTLSAERAGVFVPRAQLGSHVDQGQLVGVVSDPLTAEVVDEVKAPRAGKLFSLREYPVVYPGSLVARILGGAL